MSDLFENHIVGFPTRRLNYSPYDVRQPLYIILLVETKRIYDGVEAETRKSQASFQIIQISSEALPRMRLE